MVKASRVSREVGYPYMLMPDHVAVAKNDPDGLQSFAFCYGYIRGLISRWGERRRASARWLAAEALPRSSALGADSSA
jgi:hypothetical protein